MSDSTGSFAGAEAIERPMAMSQGTNPPVAKLIDSQLKDYFERLVVACQGPLHEKVSAPRLLDNASMEGVNRRVAPMGGAHHPFGPWMRATGIVIDSSFAQLAPQTAMTLPSSALGDRVTAALALAGRQLILDMGDAVRDGLALPPVPKDGDLHRALWSGTFQRNPVQTLIESVQSTVQAIAFVSGQLPPEAANDPAAFVSRIASGTVLNTLAATLDFTTLASGANSGRVIGGVATVIEQDGNVALNPQTRGVIVHQSQVMRRRRAGYSPEQRAQAAERGEAGLGRGCPVAHVAVAKAKREPTAINRIAELVVEQMQAILDGRAIAAPDAPRNPWLFHMLPSLMGELPSRTARRQGISLG